MKIIALICGFGLIQVGITHSVQLFKQPPAHLSFFLQKDEVSSGKWEYSRCGHKNSAWTSICGKCGRSK